MKSKLEKMVYANMCLINMNFWLLLAVFVSPILFTGGPTNWLQYATVALILGCVYRIYTFKKELLRVLPRK